MRSNCDDLSVASVKCVIRCWTGVEVQAAAGQETDEH